MVSASKYIQLAVNRLHEDEEGYPDKFLDNAVHIRIQQWSVFDDFAFRAEGGCWWRRYADGLHPDTSSPMMEDRGRER